MIKNFITITEVAKKLHVSRQRVHQLLTIYGIKVHRKTSRFFLVDCRELKKIPKVRHCGTRVKRT